MITLSREQLLLMHQQLIERYNEYLLQWVKDRIEYILKTAKTAISAEDPRVFQRL